MRQDSLLALVQHNEQVIAFFAWRFGAAEPGQLGDFGKLVGADEVHYTRLRVTS